MAVLIESDKWLEKLENVLSTKDAASRTPLEETMLGLAHKVRNDYLRFEYTVPAEGMPPHKKAKIETKVGDGLSQYAFAGALGPDFPAAADILAINHRWVADTLHKGSSRRAWKNAHTTQFILYSPNNINGVIRNPSNEVFTDMNRLYTTLRMGHLASIAAHVIMQPFIAQWSWSNAGEQSTLEKIAPWPLASNEKPGDPIRFNVQIDAQLAKGYFQRDDLHQGQSWTDYLPEDDQAINFICAAYLEAFSATYGIDLPIFTPDQSDPNDPEHEKLKPAAAIFPKERSCEVPNLDDLTKAFPDLDPLLKRYPKLATKLSHWRGWPVGFFIYDDLFTEDDDKDVDEATRKEINDAVGKIKGLADKLKDYPCSTPRLDHAFLKNGYHNTKDWALDAGYDHAPWVTSLVMSAVVAFTSANPIKAPDNASAIVQKIFNILGFGVTQNVWGTTVNFDASTSAAVMATNRQAWIDKGLANEIIWFDIFDNSYGANGLPLFVLNAVFSGVSLIGFDGLFGQNSDALAGLPKYHWRKLFVFFNDLFSPLILFPVILNGPAVDWYRQPAVRWLFYWIVNVGFDGFEELFVAADDRSLGRQGDSMGLRLWYLRLWLTGAFVLSSALTFGVKASSDRSSPNNDLNAQDYLLGLVFPLVLIGTIVWWKSGFEGALLQSLTGVDWPSADTALVNDLLPVGEKDVEGQKQKLKFLRDDTGTPLPVALFKDALLKLGNYVAVDGNVTPNVFFPEADPSTRWDDIPNADDSARKQAHQPSAKTYRLKQLFDRAAMFSGLLSMALANCEKSSGASKDLAAAIFKDWNLSFRTEDEWNDLMETREDGTPGLLLAAEQWWNAVSAPTPSAPDPSAVAQLEIAMGLKAGPAMISGMVEERSVAPNNNSPDTAHIPLAKMPYTIVDKDGKVVFSGATNENGGFQVSLPGPADYEMRIEGYQGVAG